ncbi:hypothetical protein, partial [Pseudomonas aeruginosa]
NTTEQMTPEFLAAGRLYTSMCKAGLSHTPEAAAAFQHMYDAAPESFRQEMHDMAVQMGLMPAVPDGYTDDGEPVYELEGMAKRLGIDPEEAKRKAEELGLKPNTLKVHRVN